MCEHFPGMAVRIEGEYIHEMMDMICRRGEKINVDFFSLIDNVQKRIREFEESINTDNQHQAEMLFLLNLAMLTKYLYPIMEQMNESTLRHVSFDLFDGLQD